MKFEKLFEVLEKESKTLQNLLDLVMKKQRVLVQMDRENLDEIIAKEEKLILAVKKDEKARIEVVQSIYDELNLKFENPKLQVLMDNLGENISDDEKARVEEYEYKIKDLTLEISEVNHRNLFLIQHSRNFINETINILLNKKKSILDKRV